MAYNIEDEFFYDPRTGTVAGETEDYYVKAFRLAHELHGHLATCPVPTSAREARLDHLLKEANELLRSASSVCDREGLQTNWKAFHKQIKDALGEQHRFMHPENYIPE